MHVSARVCTYTCTRQSAVTSACTLYKNVPMFAHKTTWFLRLQFSNFLARFWYLSFTLHTIRCEFQKSHLKKTPNLLIWMLQKPFSAVLAFNNQYLFTVLTQLICYDLSSWSPILQLLFSHVFPLNFDLVFGFILSKVWCKHALQ